MQTAWRDGTELMLVIPVHGGLSEAPICARAPKTRRMGWLLGARRLPFNGCHLHNSTPRRRILMQWHECSPKLETCEATSCRNLPEPSSDVEPAVPPPDRPSMKFPKSWPPNVPNAYVHAGTSPSDADGTPPTERP